MSWLEDEMYNNPAAFINEEIKLTKKGGSKMGNDAWKLKCLEEADKGNIIAMLYKAEIASNVNAPRAFEKWTPEEDERLKANVEKFLVTIAGIHHRKPSAIMFRLVKYMNEIGIKLG